MNKKRVIAGIARVYTDSMQTLTSSDKEKADFHLRTIALGHAQTVAYLSERNLVDDFNKFLQETKEAFNESSN